VSVESEQAVLRTARIYLDKSLSEAQLLLAITGKICFLLTPPSQPNVRNADPFLFSSY
jgi:hypothetical protein